MTQGILIILISFPVNNVKPKSGNKCLNKHHKYNKHMKYTVYGLNQVNIYPKQTGLVVGLLEVEVP